MSVARGLVKMARAKAKRVGPLRKWWYSKSEHHFQVYTLTTIFFSGLILYCFIFLFFMDGVQSLQNDGKDNLIPKDRREKFRDHFWSVIENMQQQVADCLAELRSGSAKHRTSAKFLYRNLAEVRHFPRP